MLKNYSRLTLVSAFGLYFLTLFYLFFEFSYWDWGFYFDLEYFFSSYRFWFLMPPLFVIPFTFFYRNGKNPKIYKLAPIIAFIISISILIIEGFEIEIILPNLLGIVLSSIFVLKPNLFLPVRITKFGFKVMMYSLFVIQFIWLLIYTNGIDGYFSLFYTIKYSVPFLGSLLFFGLIQAPLTNPDKRVNEIKSKVGFFNQAKISQFLDPKNPIWLEILRYTVIIWSSLILVSGFLLSIIYTINLYEYFNPLFFLVIFIAFIVFALLNFVLGMISLNLLFNVQAIRISIEKKDNHS